MDYKGYCLWADDIPNTDAPHYIVIASSENPEGKVLVVAISSIKYRENGSEKYYDKACILSENDIIDDKGNNVLSRPSFIRYEYAVEIVHKDLLKKQFNNHYRYKCKISDDLLKRIQDGAKISQELEPRFCKYFNFF